MRFLFIAGTVSALLGIASGAARCVSDGCKCDKGLPGGVYCGYCPEVNVKGERSLWSDVYHCAKDTGNCCRYGPRASCKLAAKFGPCGGKRMVGG
jgi:hypothetical protein